MGYVPPPMVPRVGTTLGTPATPYTPCTGSAVTAVRAARAARSPGLRRPVRARLRCARKCACALPFPYLRPVSPGHPDRLLAIRGKCWIASRSQLAGTYRGQEPWRVPGGPPRASWEAMGPGSGPPRPRIRASQTTDPGIPGPGSWPSRAARLPGNVESGQLSTEG